jgi:hypothetical protein
VALPVVVVVVVVVVLVFMIVVVALMVTHVAPLVAALRVEQLLELASVEEDPAAFLALVD